LVDGWIQPTSDALLPILTKQTAPADVALGYALTLAGSQLTFTVANEGSSVSGMAAVSPTLDAQWHLVAATFSRGSATGGKLYYDGALVSTFDTTPLSGTVETDAELHLGEQPSLGRGLAQHWFSGGLDEVELFDRALTGLEVLAIYDAGAFGKCDKPPTPTPTPSSLRKANQPVERAGPAGVSRALPI
jgi:hypothetical protein